MCETKISACELVPVIKRARPISGVEVSVLLKLVTPSDEGGYMIAGREKTHHKKQEILRNQRNPRGTRKGNVLLHRLE